MNKVLMAFIFLLVCAIIAGCGGSRNNNGFVSGTVLDFNGNRIQDAEVTVDGSPGSVQSTITGSFLVDNVPTGWTTFRAKKLVDGVQYIGETAHLVYDDRQSFNIIITLTPDSSVGDITGRVRDNSGHPLSNAKVFAEMAIGSIVAMTDNNGYYTLKDVPALTTKIKVTASLTGYDNSIQYVDVVPNDTKTVSFTLNPAQNGSIQAPEKPVAEAWTYPEAVNRSPGAYEAVKAKLSRLYKSQAIKSQKRDLPPNSLIEADLYWNSNTETNIYGYGIYRGFGNSQTFDTIELVRDPSANFFMDLSPGLDVGLLVSYKISAAGTDANENLVEGPQSPATSVTPLNKLYLNSPDNGSSVDAGNLTFTWNIVTGVDSYSVFLYDTVPDYNVTEIWSKSNITGNSISYDGPALQSGHTYYWMVAGTSNQSGNTAYTVSSTWQFVVR